MKNESETKSKVEKLAGKQRYGLDRVPTTRGFGLEEKVRLSAKSIGTYVIYI